MTRVLLTGAGGFVGSHALRHILTVQPTWHVVCPVTFTHRGKADRIRLALADIPGSEDRVTVVKCDLAAPISPQTDERFGPIDYVLNFASESHVDRSIQYPAAFIQNNVALITNLLDWCRARPELQGIVHISTDEVYGPARHGYAHKEWDPILPSNPYSASKAAQEAVCFAYWRTYNLPIIITNTMNIIGETQDPEKFIPMVMHHLANNLPVPVHARPMIKTGEHVDRWLAGSRFYLHARNQADGVLFALGVGMDNDGAGLRYSDGSYSDRPLRLHIVGEREVHNDTMVRMIGEAMGLPNVNKMIEYVDFHSTRPGHDLRYALDGSEIAAYGWKPPVPLEESLHRLVQWTLEHPEWLL